MSHDYFYTRCKNNLAKPQQTIHACIQKTLSIFEFFTWSHCQQNHLADQSTNGTAVSNLTILGAGKWFSVKGQRVSFPAVLLKILPQICTTKAATDKKQVNKWAWAAAFHSAKERPGQIWPTG